MAVYLWNSVCDLAFRQTHFPVGSRAGCQQSPQLAQSGSAHAVDEDLRREEGLEWGAGHRAFRRCECFDSQWTFMGWQFVARCQQWLSSNSVQPSLALWILISHWMTSMSLPPSLHTEANLFLITRAQNQLHLSWNKIILNSLYYILNFPVCNSYTKWEKNCTFHLFRIYQEIPILQNSISVTSSGIAHTH